MAKREQVGIRRSQNQNPTGYITEYSSWCHGFGKSWECENTKTWIFWEQNKTFLKNKFLVPQMTHFEKVLFCRGGNL